MILGPGLTIKRGDCQARSAEDLVNPAIRNLFEEDPPDHFRSIEANVVHYNPEWRFRDEKNVEHRKYLLPSRKFPRIPKSVLPANPADRITENFVPDVTAGVTVDLKAQLRGKLTAIMKTGIALSPSPGSQPVTVTSILPPGTGPIIDVDNAQGWHYLDSYLSHYFFVVEADEEHEITNDTFEFEVQRLYTRMFTTGKAHFGVGAGIPLDWFWRARMVAAVERGGSRTGGRSAQGDGSVGTIASKMG